MSKYLYGPTVRINVSADFSIAATLAPECAVTKIG